MSKAEAKSKIESYFAQEDLIVKDTKKIKKLAMKNRIRLGEYRKRFCKKCYADLKTGKIRNSKRFKSATCSNCNYINRFKIS